MKQTPEDQALKLQNYGSKGKQAFAFRNV